MSRAERDIRRKLLVFEYFRGGRNVAKTRRHFGIAGQSFYDWKDRNKKSGDEGQTSHKILSVESGVAGAGP